MSEQPQVVCVMLTADRHELATKAIEYFRAQTYERKRLLVLDTGNDSVGYLGDYDDIQHNWADLSLKSWPIARLRNEANRRAGECDVLIHWDDDDYSAPTRIAEQVAFLQASGADAVGYSEMLFWDTRVWCSGCSRAVGGPHWAGCPRQGTVVPEDDYRERPGEAWIFRTGHPGIALGTSLAYWTSTWQRVPFPATLTGRGEDSEWLQRVKCAMQPAFCLGCTESSGWWPSPDSTCSGRTRHDPRMIARIHAGNTSNPAYNREEMARNAKLPGVLRQWERAPQFDQICREVLG